MPKARVTINSKMKSIARTRVSSKSVQLQLHPDFFKLPKHEQKHILQHEKVHVTGSKADSIREDLMCLYAL